MKNKTPIPMVDVIIQKEEEVVLVKRAREPFKGCWAIPGGHVDYNETVESSARREAKEETGLEVRLIEILGVYSEPKRDPRYHAISTVFIAEPLTEKLAAGGDVGDVRWFRLNEIDYKNLAFDHAKILKDYVSWRKTKETYWSTKC